MVETINNNDNDDDDDDDDDDSGLMMTFLQDCQKLKNFPRKCSSISLKFDVIWQTIE